MPRILDAHRRAARRGGGVPLAAARQGRRRPALQAAPSGAARRAGRGACRRAARGGRGRPRDRLEPAAAMRRDGRAVRRRGHAGRDRRSRPGGTLRRLRGATSREPARPRRRHRLDGAGAPGEPRAAVARQRPPARALSRRRRLLRASGRSARAACAARRGQGADGPGTSAQAGGRAGPYGPDGATCARHGYGRGRHCSLLGRVVAGAAHGLATRRRRAAEDRASVRRPRPERRSISHCARCRSTMPKLGSGRSMATPTEPARSSSGLA